MSKTVATPKQTAGGGFAFEDKVVGYYLVWMLAGTAPFQQSGQMTRLDCQVAADGWAGFDDLLISFVHGGTPHRHALSLKSNCQFGKDSAPVDLVTAAWSLLLHTRSDVMDVACDRLGLVCVPHPEPPKLAIQSLLTKARRQTPAQLAARLPESGYASDTERQIHNSFSCPSSLAAGLSKEQTLPGNILRRMSVIELDFENHDSSSEAMVLFVSAGLVADGTDATARSLWNAFCQTAQGLRTAGGGIAREELLAEVRSVVSLRTFPDYAEDWQHLDAWRDTELSAIPDRVGGETTIDRGNVIAQVATSLQQERFVSLIGASGTGKTVIAKQVVEGFRDVGNVLWLDGGRLRPGYLEELGSHRSLRHPLKDVIGTGKGKSGLLAVDRAERLLNEQDFAELCLLLHILEMEREGCVWRVLLTCREEAWDRVQFSLIRAFGRKMRWVPVRVEYPRFRDLNAVWSAFPVLRVLAVRPHLAQVMRNLKVLDLLATAISTGSNLGQYTWLGESELIRWYWQHVVRGGEVGSRRDVLLRSLATDNADSGQFETAETALTTDDLALVGQSSDLLRTDAARGIVYFAHDLIADWARFQVLVSHDHELARFCADRFTNPHWHTALRLYGVSLLEADKSGKRWMEAISAHPNARDSFLESLVFAGNAQQLLDGAWSALVADDGTLLNAFLKRFQYVASIPNPEYVALASQLDCTPEEVRTWERLPLWMYWLGVLQALAGHLADLVRLAPTETARLARSWLRHAPDDWPRRQEAATLAVAVAEETICQGSYHHGSDSDSQLHYRALLEAYPDKPEAVRDLLLLAAARRIPTVDDGGVFEDYRPPGKLTRGQPAFMVAGRIEQEPWPDGPFYRVDSAFRAACFEMDALRAVMLHAPDLAREIILALLIERRPPTFEPNIPDGCGLPEDAVCLEDDNCLYPRFYTKGPFLLFFRVNPDAALKTVIQLIGFATDRWMECHYGEHERTSGIDLAVAGAAKRFIGDYKVFHWYHGFAVSDIVTSALMATEKWLYDCLDRKESIDPWIDAILTTSQSMAFVGLLTEIGRYAPELLAGSLRPLLLVPDLYYFETLFLSQDGHAFGTPYSFMQGEAFFNLARAWDTMEHRQRRLIDAAVYLFHHDRATREVILAARDEWSKVPDDSDDVRRRTNANLAAVFDLQNWKELKQPDGSTNLVYEEPEHLKTPADQLAQSGNQILLLTLPMSCRRLLESGTPLKVDDIAPFLAKSKELLGVTPTDAVVGQLSPVANAILGTVAVLFVLHREWLRDNPKEEAWCVEMLDKILADPPPWPEFDMPESVGNHDWEHFACDIASVLWSEHPADTVSRERIAHLAFARHYSAAGILLSRAFENRQTLGSSFWQLVNLLLDWSSVRYEIRDCRVTGKSVDVSKWVDEATTAFVTGRYEAEVPRWGVVSLSKGKLWAPHNPPRYLGNRKNVNILSRVPKLDVTQIKGSFQSVFLPEQATSTVERKVFFDFWDEALVTCLAATCFFDETGHEITNEVTEAGMPHKYDSWVLERLAVVIAQMTSEESPDRYWKPILALGARGEHWVADFLHHWFTDTRKAMNPAAFTREWVRMLVFCLDSDAWVARKDRSSFHLPSLWLYLMGCPRFGISLWQAEDAPLIEEMGPFFVRVAPRVLDSAHNAVKFLSWLSRPEAKGIRRLMLAPVSCVSLKATDHWWEEEHLAKMMAGYLGILWTEQGQILRQVPADEKVFLALVHRTAGTQEPLAMELQARIAAHR